MYGFWKSENPRVVIEHERYSPELYVFCAVSRGKVYGPFFFYGNTIKGTLCLQMIKDWLYPRLQVDGDDFYLQQEWNPLHWSLKVRKCLQNDQLPQRWIGGCSADDATFCPLPSLVHRIRQYVNFFSLRSHKKQCLQCISPPKRS